MAEQNYFEAGLTCDGKPRLFDKDCKREEFQLLSGNARFQSLRGLFNAEIAADETMTPMQREFVRLAQIFKSRLIVEMELRQRVMERSIIEERLGDRQQELRSMRRKEDAKSPSKRPRMPSEMREAKKTVLLRVRRCPRCEAKSDKTEESEWRRLGCEQVIESMLSTSRCEDFGQACSDKRKPETIQREAAAEIGRRAGCIKPH